jgi:DNA-binding Lrp family transcriptional regulator
MDKKDMMIMQMLKEGKKIKEIQKKLGISRQSVYYRIQRLKKGVSLKETVSADFEKLGYNSLILCLIKWNFQDYDGAWNFADKYIFKNPNTCLYMILLGEWDAVAVFACRSQNEYYEKILHTILSNGGPYLKDWVSIPITQITSGGINLPNLIETTNLD